MMNNAKNTSFLWGPAILTERRPCEIQRRPISLLTAHVEDIFALCMGFVNPFLPHEVTLMDHQEATEVVMKVLRKLAVGNIAFASTLSKYQFF